MSVDEFNGAALCLKKDQLQKIRPIKKHKAYKTFGHINCTIETAQCTEKVT